MWVAGFLLAYIFIDSHPSAPIRTKINTYNLDWAAYFEVCLKIYLNNLLVSLLITLGGLVSGGILTLLIFLYNGFIIGVSMIMVYQLTHDLPLVLSEVFWHGGVEIAGFLYLGIVGLEGFSLLKHIYYHGKLDLSILDLQKIKKNCLIGLICLTIAALIEGMVIFLV